MRETSEVQAAAPVVGPPEVPTMSAVGTVAGVFTKPRTTFQALAARPRVLAPMLLLVIVQVVIGVLLVQSGVIMNDAVARLEAQGKPQETIDAVQKIFEGPAKYVFGVLGPAVGVAFSLLVGGGLLYFMGNLMLGARLRFRHYLSVAAYGGVVGVVDQVVRTALGVARGTLLVHAGVGAFLGDTLSVPLRLLDAATDPLLLWAMAVQALGVGVMAKKSFGFGALAVVPAFLILLLVSALQK